MAYGFYVASRASIPARAQMWRDWRAAGVPITSSWIDEDGEGQTADFTELWLRIEREIVHSANLVLYAEPGDFPLKGALVEVGIALGYGCKVFIVIPGVELNGRTLRPLGSWAKHPNCTFASSLEDVFGKPAPTPAQESGQ